MLPRTISEDFWRQRRLRRAAVGLVLLSIFLGVIIVPIEVSQGHFLSYEDGLWWSITTVSGVGYGDIVPITTLGRIVGALLQALGVVMLGLIVGMMASLFTKRQDELFWEREFYRLDMLSKKLESVEKKIDYLVREISDVPPSPDPETLEES